MGQPILTFSQFLLHATPFKYVLKMEYGWYFTIFGLEMMMKSGLENLFLKFLYAHYVHCVRGNGRTR